MKRTKYNVLGMCVSVLCALVALLGLLKGLGGLQVSAAPPIPALLLPDDGTATRDPEIQFGWTDVGASTYHLKVDAIEYTVADTSETLILVDGVHTWTVEAVDVLGNGSGYADEWTVTVDTTPPDVPVLSGPADGAVFASADIQFSWEPVSVVGDEQVFYNLDVDGFVYTTTTTSMVLALGEGVHIWAVQAQDWLDHVSDYTEQRTVTVDTEHPVTSFVIPENGAVLTTTHLYTVTISGTASDVGTGLDRVEVNTGAGWDAASGTSAWSYEWPLPFFDNLPVTLKVRAVDRAGNESTVSQVGVTVDSVAPASGIPIPDRSPWVTSTVVYDWPPSLDGSGVERYQIHVYNTLDYDEVFGTVGSEYTFAQATEESAGYYARVRALDGRGNWGTWSDPSEVVTPELIVPTVWGPYIVEDSAYLHAVGTMLYYTNTMDLPQLFEVRGYAHDTPSNVKQVCFTLAFGEQPACDTAGFQPWQSGNPSYAVDLGAPAGGVIEVNIYDFAGNMAQQTFTFELDGTPPESSVSSPEYATSSPILVVWTANDTQSDVHSVALWYKYASADTWTYAQSTYPSGESNGSFLFEPIDGSGTYIFGIKVQDKVGNAETDVVEASAPTVYDTSTPVSSVTWAPTYWNHTSVPITMTWVASPTLAPLDEVRLWYRYNQGEWKSTSLVSSGPDTWGVFSFGLPEGEGRYDFATVALDAKGASEALPFDVGDKTTLYDTEIGSPLDLNAIPDDWSRTNSFTVQWSNPDDLAGIVAAYFKVGAAPVSPRDGTRVLGDDVAQLTDILLPSEGWYPVWVWLEDRAGNLDHTSARGIPCKYDASVGAPSGLAASPAGWTTSDVFAVTWGNPSDLSGIAGAYWKLDSRPDSAEDGKWVPGANLDQIDEITVVGEGEHTLYLWLRDQAGNIGFDERQTVSLLSDPTPPAAVWFSVPISSTTVSFDVYWSANAAASGVLGYTVEFKRDIAGAEWQSWLPFTTETLAVFSAPLADAQYRFRVTAHDRAGNSAQAETTVYVEPQRVYMPVLFSLWRDWYRNDIYEPNDTPAEAYGPLKVGQAYNAPIWNQEDVDDYYYFEMPSNAKIKIRLTNIPQNTDYDLYVYYFDGAKYVIADGGKALSDEWGTKPEEIVFRPTPAQKYWILVHPYGGPYPEPPPNNYSSLPYRLMMSYDPN